VAVTLSSNALGIPMEPVAILAVADGMGGVYGGEVASALATQTVRDAISQRWSEGRQKPDDSVWIDALREAFDRCAVAFQARIEDDRELAGMGTTLTAMVLDGHSVSYAHLGDSRGYLFRHGELTKLTTDHNVAGELLAQGRISPEQAADHQGRNVLTKWIGTQQIIEPEVGAFKPASNDYYLLCTDGLYALIPEAEIEQSLRNLPSAVDKHAIEELTAMLVDRANERGGKDNISLVIAHWAHWGSPG
jgi:serine/threonine protein phosphatase PrpC